MTIWFTVILVVYLVAMLLIGAFGAKKSQSTEDYLLAGRKLPVWMMAFSVVAGFFGSEVAMGASGTAYTMGWTGGAGIPLGWAICLIVMGCCFTEKMRAMRVYNISDFFAVKYGEKVGVISAVVIVIGQLFWVAALNIGIAKTLTAFLGWDYNIAVGIGLTIVLIYTVAGGLWSGVITDVIQFIILAVATVVLAVVSMKVAGGWDAIRAVAPPENLSFVPKDITTVIFVVGGLLSPIFSGVITPDGNSRLMAGKSPKASKRAAFLSAPIYLILGVLCMLIGFAGTVVYPNIKDAEMIFPTFALDYLPPVFAALVMIGLVSVVMSSADSALLASATLLTRNVYQPLIKGKDSDDKKSLRRVRLAVVLCGLFSIVISILSAQIENAMVLLNMITAGIWLTLAPLIWFGFYWKKANKTAGVCTAIFSAAFLIIWYSISIFVNPAIGSLHMSDIPGELLCTPIGLLIFCIVGNATYQKDRPVEIDYSEQEG